MRGWLHDYSGMHDWHGHVTKTRGGGGGLHHGEIAAKISRQMPAAHFENRNRSCRGGGGGHLDDLGAPAAADLLQDGVLDALHLGGPTE